MRMKVRICKVSGERLKLIKTTDLLDGEDPDTEARGSTELSRDTLG